jgi:hypothetical protein
MEVSDSVYQRWLSYKQKNGFEHDSGALLHLLDELRYDESDFLNFIHDAAIMMVEASGVVSEEELAKLDFLTHSLCDCELCTEGKVLAHTNSRGDIRVSRKNIGITLDRKMPIQVGLFEFLLSYLHEVVHNIYPSAPRDHPIPSSKLPCSKLVREKTREIWQKGMVKIIEVLYQNEKKE